MKVGTVFSGIGAIEHALLRMDLDHELMFACDNGDVDIFSRKIDIDINALEDEFHTLKNMINAYEPKTDSDKEYKEELENELQHNREMYDSVGEDIDNLAGQYADEPIVRVLGKILDQSEVKLARHKEYTSFRKSIINEDNTRARLLKRMQSSVECVNDFKKDNDLDSLRLESELQPNSMIFKSKDNIDWALVWGDLSDSYIMSEEMNAKKIIRRVRDVAERLGMLHEKIQSYHLRKKVDAAPTYKDKKEASGMIVGK